MLAPAEDDLPIKIKMIKVLVAGLVLSCLFPFDFGNDGYINPTGTYSLEENTKMKDGDKFGYFGTIQVKLIQKDKIAITFYICKGAPSYNSGSFIDTLDYIDNKAEHRDEYSNDCLTEFLFNKKSITVVEKEEKRTCWGHGVFAHGVYKKQSSEIPVLKDPLTDDVLE